MAITSKAIQDLLDELESSKQSRLRAWNVLQRLRLILSDSANVAIASPAQKTLDAEGEALEHALTKTLRIRNEAIQSLCSSVRRFRDATIKEECKGDYPHALQALWKALDRADYRRTTAQVELARRYHIPIPPQRDLPISWNTAPTQDVLAIRLHPETRQRTLDSLRWGLIPNWAKDPKIAYKTIKARVETIDTAPSYRQAFGKRLCLIPADGFFEWKKVPGGKIPYLIVLHAEQVRNLSAGIPHLHILCHASTK